MFAEQALKRHLLKVEVDVDRRFRRHVARLLLRAKSLLRWGCEIDYILDLNLCELFQMLLGVSKVGKGGPHVLPLPLRQDYFSQGEEGGLARRVE